jgi:hypothetical protein
VAGTVSEELRPEHWQVTAGVTPERLAARDSFEGDKLQTPFSLGDVREAATPAPPK